MATEVLVLVLVLVVWCGVSVCACVCGEEWEAMHHTHEGLSPCGHRPRKHPLL